MTYTFGEGTAGHSSLKVPASNHLQGLQVHRVPDPDVGLQCITSLLQFSTHINILLKTLYRCINVYIIVFYSSICLYTAFTYLFIHLLFYLFIYLFSLRGVKFIFFIAKEVVEGNHKRKYRIANYNLFVFFGSAKIILNTDISKNEVQFHEDRKSISDKTKTRPIQ